MKQESKGKAAAKSAPRRRRDYSDREKGEALAVLDAEGGNATVAAKKAGVPKATLQDWAAERGTNPDVQAEREEAKKELADRLEGLAHKCLDILPGKLPEASVRDIAGALIVAVDKMQLLRGKPTAIEGVGEMTDDERARRAAEILSAGKARLQAVK